MSLNQTAAVMLAKGIKTGSVVDIGYGTTQFGFYYDNFVVREAKLNFGQEEIDCVL